MNIQSASKVKVERYGLEKVPQSQQRIKWYEYVMIQGSFIVNTGNFLVPALAVMQGGLPIFVAIIVTTIGATLAFLFVSALSIPGAKYGIPAQYAFRYILGVRGTQFVSSPFRVITSLYWFGVQTIGVAFVLKEALQIYFNINVPFLLITLTLGATVAIIAIVGFDAIKKTLTFTFPILVLGQIVMLILIIKAVFLSNVSATISTSGQEFSLSVALFYGSLAFVQYIASINSSSDITRYSKNYKHGCYGLFIGNVVGFIFTAVLATMSAYYFKNVNPFVATMQLTDSKILLFIILLSALLSMLSINVNNAYSGSFSLLNSFPRIGRIGASVFFGIIAITLCMFPVLVYEAEKYISMLGLIVIPLAAVVTVDYLWIKKGKLINENQDEKLTPFHYNKIGLILIMVGAMLYYFIPNTYSPGFISFICIGLAYGLLKRSEVKA